MTIIQTLLRTFMRIFRLITEEFTLSESWHVYVDLSSCSQMLGSELSVNFRKELVFNWDHGVSIYLYNHEKIIHSLARKLMVGFANLAKIST